MKSIYILLTCLFHFTLSAVATSHENEMLRVFAEEIHPQIAEIFQTYLANFKDRKVLSWTYSPQTRYFAIELEKPLKLWVESSKPDEPKKGSVLILGEAARSGKTVVEGLLHKNEKNIEFKKGFSVYCRYKIGFASMPITAHVYNFNYQDEDHIFMEAGKNGISQKRSKTAQGFLKAWNHPEGVVEGDHVSFLKTKE